MQRQSKGESADRIEGPEEIIIVKKLSQGC